MEISKEELEMMRQRVESSPELKVAFNNLSGENQLIILERMYHRMVLKRLQKNNPPDHNFEKE